MSIAYLPSALADLLGPPTRGDLVFVRCLDAQTIRLVLADPTLGTHGWGAFAVGAEDVPAAGLIRADRAVEIRESKGTAALLLVDVMNAGAGMDGVYSAARELCEHEVFSRAATLAK